MSNDWIDISVPIHTGMVHWPDNPPVLVEYMLHIERGDVCTVSTLSRQSRSAAVPAIGAGEFPSECIVLHAGSSASANTFASRFCRVQARVAGPQLSTTACQVLIRAWCLKLPMPTV